MGSSKFIVIEVFIQPGSRHNRHSQKNSSTCTSKNARFSRIFLGIQKVTQQECLSNKVFLILSHLDSHENLYLLSILFKFGRQIFMRMTSIGGLPKLRC